MIRIQLFVLPTAAKNANLQGTTAVAIDVLRASTSIISALGEGADSILPCQTVAEARQLSASHPDALLGGERHGVLIDGFDLSNSPASYRKSIVANRTIIFTSTNGTKAIAACDNAEQTLVGGFVNLSAICQRIVDRRRTVSLVCAGTNGEPSSEDLLLGGAICDQLLTDCEKKGESKEKPAIAPTAHWNPAARAAWQMWRAAQREIDFGRSLAEILAETQGGKNIVPLGLMPDIHFASNIDRFSLVPMLDRTSGRLRSDVDLAARRG